jgi:hypothetical protein
VRLISLDINFDPDLPPCMQGPRQEPVPKPRFPYDWKLGGVRVGPLAFVRKHASNAGPRHDPYAGDVWTCNIGKLEFEYSTVISVTMALRWGSRSIFDIRESSFKDLPPPCMLVADFLESRHEWFMENECQEDPYGSLSYWE